MAKDLFYILAGFSFLMGTLIASFLNVVIWRVPRGESIVSPPSHCPKCNAPIRWYQNIPILSWLCLRGRCAKCHEPISPRYILIETLGGLLFLGSFLQIGFYAPIAWVVFSLFIVISFTDFDLKLIMSRHLYELLGVGLLLGVSDYFWGVAFCSWIDTLVGAAFGFAIMWAIAFLGKMVFRREAMGDGDVWLMAGIGAVFGHVAVVFTLIGSSVIGSIFGVSMILLNKIKLGKFVEIPFGPYICLAATAWFFYGQELVNWYMMLLTGK